MLRQTLRSYSPGGVVLELGPLSPGNGSSFVQKQPLAIIEFSVLLCFARFHVSVFWGTLTSLTGDDAEATDLAGPGTLVTTRGMRLVPSSPASRPSLVFFSNLGKYALEHRGIGGSLCRATCPRAPSKGCLSRTIAVLQEVSTVHIAKYVMVSMICVKNYIGTHPQTCFLPPGVQSDHASPSFQIT